MHGFALILRERLPRMQPHNLNRGCSSVRRTILAFQLTAVLVVFFLVGCSGIAAPNGNAGGNQAVAPSMTTQPTSTTVTAGQTATFSVLASGTATISYQ